MDTGKGGENPPLSRSCEALNAANVSQNARQVSPRRASTVTHFTRPGQWLRASSFAALPVLLLAPLAPALAHHPFGMGEGAELNGWKGLLSAIGHHLLGPDHVLLLLALTFVGLRRPQDWTVLLPAVGLVGSGLASGSGRLCVCQGRSGRLSRAGSQQNDFISIAST